MPGVLTGLNNQALATSANLATLVYNARAQVDTVNFQTTTGSTLASDQFGYYANLRPTSDSATWQSGSGTSGSMLSQSRSYDPASNVISLSTTQAAVPGQSGSGGSESQNFCYDEQNRLVWDCPELVRQLKANGVVQTISPETVGRILRSHKLKPWRHHLWLSTKVPRDDHFAHLVHTLVELYTCPLSEEEMVVCVDEKTNLQPRPRLAATLPARSAYEPGGAMV